MKTIFFGSSDYCLPILESLGKHFTLTIIITKKGQAVERYALSHNINVFTPKDKVELLQLKDLIKESQSDLAVVADYGLIIPKDIFTIPLNKTLNIHFSKLPKLRGPSPVQYTILMGGKKACISIIIMDEQMDTGNIVWQKDIDLSGNETTASLYTYLFNIAALDLPNVLNKYVLGELNPRNQDHSLATYTKHFSREDGFTPTNILLNSIKGIKPQEEEIKKWSLKNILDTKYLILNTSIVIERALRAFTPWPGLWTTVQITNNKQQIAKRLKILKSHLDAEKLVLDLVQLEGKKSVSWKQLQEGYKIELK